MADFIIGDAFKEDRIIERTYGLPVSSSNYSVAFTDDVETPEPMCNTVSIIKLEALNPHSRNLVAVSESYICYPVKKVKLRAIHTESSKLGLFQGHSYPIVDLKFSAVDRTYLCSICDNVGDELSFPGTPCVIIRQLKFDDELDSVILAQFNMPASIVQSHPKIADVFAIAHGKHIAVISGSQRSRTDSYETLPLHLLLPANITDISFSTDGTKLIVVTSLNGQSDISIITLPSASELCVGEGVLMKIDQRRLHAETSWSEILSVICLPCGILTASRATTVSNSSPNSATSVTVQLQLLSMVSRSGYLDIIQSVKVTLPIPPNASTEKSNNDIKLAYKSRNEKDINFVVLCHRSSHILACVAVDVRRTLLPLCHLTFFDLKFPVFSLDTAHIAGRNYYSSDEVDHLEIGCYQIMNGKHAVQQYHFNCHTLYTEVPLHQSDENFTEVVRRLSGQSVFGMLGISEPFLSDPKLVDYSLSKPLALDMPSLTSITTPTPTIVSQPVVEAVDSNDNDNDGELTWSEIETTMTLDHDSHNGNHSTSTLSTHEEPAPLPLPEILKSNVVPGKSIMSMLHNLRATKFTTTTTVPTAPVLVPIPGPMPPSVQALLSAVHAPVTATAVAPTPTPALVPVPFPVPIMIPAPVSVPPMVVIPPPVTATTTSSVVQSPAPTVAVAAATSQISISSISKSIEIRSIERENGNGSDDVDDWAEASAAIKVSASPTPNTNTNTNTQAMPPLVGRDALDQAISNSKSNPKVRPVMPVMPEHQNTQQNTMMGGPYDGALHLKVNDLTRGVFSLAEFVSEIASTASDSSDRVSELCAMLEANALKKEQETKAQLESSFNSLKTDLLSEMKVLMESANNKSQRDLQSLSAQNIIQSRETASAVTKAVKSAMETEIKKTMEVTPSTFQLFRA